MFKKNYSLLGVSLVFLLFLYACGSGIAPSEPPTSTAETNLPSVEASPSATTEAASPTPTAPAKLKVEEYALLRNTMVGETVVSKPLEGTWEEILATHAALREDHFPREVYFSNKLQVGADQISWKIQHTPTPNADGTTTEANDILVYKNDSLLLTIPVGQSTPVNPVWGFWAVDGSWYLETATSTVTLTDNGNVMNIQTLGDIYQDGESLNSREGYEESFGFQTISGRPFYFYQRDGSLGYFYNGREYPLGYNYIPHYNCCSCAAYNPIIAKNMVAFYATKGEKLYYVEIGAFD